MGGHGRSGSCSGTFPTRPLGGRSTSRPRNGAHRPTRRGGRIRCRRRRSRLRVEDAFSRSRVAGGVEGGRRTREGRARTTARSYRSRHSFPCRAAFGLPRGNYWSNQGQGRELSRAAHFEAIPKMEIPRPRNLASGVSRRRLLTRSLTPSDDFPTRGVDALVGDAVRRARQ